MRVLLFPLLFLLTLSPFLCHGEPVRLLIVAGQSNAVGAGTFDNDLDGHPVASQPDVPFFYHIASSATATPWTSGGVWTTLGTQTGGSGPNPFYLDNSGPKGGFGPEIMLARTLADTPGLPPVAVLKVALNGTPMGTEADASGRDWWKVGGRLHQRLIDQIDAAIAAYAEDLVPAGFYWIQGESDCEEGLAAYADAYRDNLFGLIDDLRTRYQQPDLPVVIGRIDPVEFMGRDFTAHADTVRAAQTAAGETLPHTAWVNLDDLPRVGVNGDNLHFDDQAQLRLGWRLAHAHLRILADQGKHPGLRSGPNGAPPRRDVAEDLRQTGFGADGWEGELHRAPDSALQLRYNRSTDPSPYEVVLESSPDMETWTPDTSWVQVDSKSVSPQVERLTLEHPAPGPSPYFLRGGVSDPRTLEALTFESTRDLYAQMVRGWAENLNNAGTAWVSPSGDFDAAIRMVFSLAAWFSRPGRPDTIEVDGVEVDLAAPLLKALRNGTDSTHPDAWPRGSHQWDPVIMDAPLVGFAGWALHSGQRRAAGGADTVWSRLNESERADIAGFLADMPSHTYPDSWNLSVALNHISRRALADQGFPEFNTFDEAVIEDRLRVATGLHRGAGWHSGDADHDVFDDYNSLVLLSFQMMGFLMEPDRTEAETVLSNPRGRGRRDILSGVSRWIADQQWFYDDYGAHIEFGRSTAYKYGRLFSLLLAYHLETAHNQGPNGWGYDFQIFPEDTFTVGQLRRLVRLHLNHYLRNEAVDPQSRRLSTGQTPDSAAETDEPGITPGAAYWAQHVFAALWLLPDDDPFWSIPEEPLPAETGAFEQWIPVPGFLLRGRGPTTGHLELINVGNWIDTSTPENFERYINKYNKFAYSSRLGWITRSGSLLDQCLMINDQPRNRPEGDVFRPGDVPEGTPTVARTVAEIGGRRVSTLIFLHGDAHIRVHRVSGASGYRLREGGYALGRESAETATTQSGPGWIYTESSQGAVYLQRLLGYESGPTILNGDGNHSRDAAWTLPHLEIPAVSPGNTFFGSLAVGSSYPFSPGEFIDLVDSIEIVDEGARVNLRNGETFHAPFLP